jgi:dihydroxyacid dehydratase/phosphogluconate dehydratase
MAWGNVTPAVNASAGDEQKYLQINSQTIQIDISENEIETAEDGEKLEQREEDTQFHWNKFMNAAELAYILFQSPVMVAIHGAEMLQKT